MIDPFGPGPEQYLTLDEARQGWPKDEDGVLIPPFWQDKPTWPTFRVTVRQKMSIEAARSIMFRKPKPERRPRATTTKSTAFTTDYAIAWGKLQGWRLLDRESTIVGRAGTNSKNRRTDILGCADAKMRKPDGGLVFLQGAGTNERAEHRSKFDRNLHRLNDFKDWEFVYLEFVRGNKTPILLEYWTVNQ